MVFQSMYWAHRRLSNYLSRHLKLHHEQMEEIEVFH
jgi:hypothetical protein